MTLIEDLVTFLQAKLNENPQEINFDLGYLFERDNDGFYHEVPNQATLKVDRVKFVPGMFGGFTSEFNKPLDFDISNQLSKGGATSLLFSLADKDDKAEEYNNSLLALEYFENKYSGKKGLTITSEGKVYNLSINVAPGNSLGAVIKFGAGWRVLFSISLAIKLNYNMITGESVKFEIKRFGAEDSLYREIVLPSDQGGLTSAFEQAQGNNERESRAGIQNTAHNRSFLIYYPTGTAYDIDPENLDPVARELLLEFFKREVDPTYNPSKKYTIRTTYPDFFGVRDYKLFSSIPTITRGAEVSMTLKFAPYKAV